MAHGQAPSLLRVEVLGPLRVVVGGVPVEVPGPKRRAVLALLALAEGRTVTADHLLDALWPAALPGSGRQALHTHVSRLRTHLGPAADRLETRYDGYLLRLGADEMDLSQARSLLAAARPRMPGDPGGALALLREAHALWRGPVLADLTDVLPIAAAVREIGQLSTEVCDALIASAIGAGQATEILGIAVASAAADPLREPAVRLLMRALAAAGRASEALDAARDHRHRLAEETGLDPSAALGELEREIAAGTTGPHPPGPAIAGSPTPGGGSPPRPATRLIGRGEQVAALHRLLAGERLVTVVGPGGVGKTRVALETAQRTGLATVLLLAPVTDGASIPHALAAALNLTNVHGDVLPACAAILRDRAGLLVIDNCEHLLDAVRDTVALLLSSCPDLSILATSREPLGLPAEYSFRLAPLPLPRPGQDLEKVPSVAVFLERAHRARPGPPPTPQDLRTVADIVRRLDGMPLAIELAAGRLSTFSLSDLRDRLDRSLDLLAAGRSSGDARHRTLRATIEWSYELLDGDEQRLFRHLSVFVDGADLNTSEDMAAELAPDREPGNVLARLVDASMLQPDFQVGTRYRMLETLRVFGLDRLSATGERQAAADRMMRWAVELTARVGRLLLTEREPEADAALRRELSNLRAAWGLARDHGSLDVAVAMIAALMDAVGYRDLVELRGWAEELAADPAIAAHPRASAVLGVAAEAAYHRGSHAEADRLARRGLDMATDAEGSWYCLLPLSVVDLARGAYEDAVAHAVAAAELVSDPREAFGVAALATLYAGDPEQARALNDRGAAWAVSPTMRAWGSYVNGEIDGSLGAAARAEQHYRRAIDLARTSGATFLVGVATVGLLTVRTGAGRTDDALRGYREVIDYFARTGNWTHQWATLRNLAGLLRRLGDDERAALLDTAADRAPDAPAIIRPPGAATAVPPAGDGPLLTRAAVLDTARQAIEHNLT